MRQFLPIEALQSWARLNGVSFHDVEIRRLQTGDGVDKGAAVVATCAKPRSGEAATVSGDPEIPLIVVPPELVLSLESVHTCAKSDRYLADVLDSVGEFSKTARGAILIFLLVLITHSHNLQHEEAQNNSKTHIGVSHPWSGYIKFFPSTFSLPTFYTPDERSLLQGTSLEPALDAKMKSMLREFEHLRQATVSIPWCEHNWWSDETGSLTFEDWKIVDAMYRSRALDLPGTGHAMVPCVDMANHASGEDTGALYETDPNGNALLQLRLGQKLQAGQEVTITYGDEKSAAEMIFSYGFLETGLKDARQVLLDLDIPDDDPLRLAKKAICSDPPGVRLFSLQPPRQSAGRTTEWESQFVWWSCVNEEDGLAFRVLQSNDGERELKIFWKDDEILSSESLLEVLKADPMWEIFQLRATLIIQTRVENQLGLLQASQQSSLCLEEQDKIDGVRIRRPVWEMVMRLRELEGVFYMRTIGDLESRKLELLESANVKAYLGMHAPGSDISEDFS